MLARGRHSNPTEGSCLMEYVSVLAGRRFNDRPDCTAPMLSWLARGVNDTVSDAARAPLAGLAPALIGTRVHRRGARGMVRAVVISELAAAGLAGAPNDPWLRNLKELATAYLARRAVPDASPTSEGTATGRRGWQPVATADGNFTFGQTCRALERIDPADRDRLLCAALTSSVARSRRLLGLPEVAVAIRAGSPGTAARN